MSVSDLAQEINARWKAHGYRAEAFPEVAAVCLERAAPHRWLDEEMIARTVLDEDCLATRRPVRCDDVLTLFSGPRFEICAHLWLDAIVEAHHHQWNGAYQVVRGVNVHARYRFVEQERIDPRLRFGELICERVELQRAGCTVPVRAGSNWIHALAYVSRPSLAVSVRTVSRAEQIRMQYWRPGLGLEAEGPDERTSEQLKLLRFLGDANRRACLSHWRAWLASADLRSCFHGLCFAQTMEFCAELVAEAREVGPATHGPVFDTMLRAFNDVERHMRHSMLRSGTLAPDRRFALAALHFAEDRATLEALAAAYLGGGSEASHWSSLVRKLLEPQGEVAARLMGPRWDDDLLELLVAFVEHANASDPVAHIASAFDVESDGDADPSDALRQVYTSFRNHRLLAPLLE